MGVLMRFVTFLAVFWLAVSAMSAAQEPETRLDAAVRAGAQDESQRAAFYDLFLDTSVYAAIVPLGSEETDEAFTGDPRPDHLRALFLASEMNGAVMIEIFDTEPRLRRFAEANDFGDYGIIFVPARDLLDAFSGDFQFYLNPGTPFSKTLSIAETRWLQERRAADQAAERSAVDLTARNRAETPAEPPAPAGPFAVTTPPEYLIQVVTTALEGHPEAEAAWLLHSGGATDDNPGAMLLVIALSEAPRADALTALVGEVNSATRGYTDGRRLQVAPTPADRAVNLAPANVAPIYTRP